MKSVEVRERLVETLGLDLVGPGIGSPHATEQLSQAPSRWYLTGFLVPIDAREEQKSDETANEGVDEMNEAGGTDDALAPEPPVARRAVFPSSMGLSLLVPKEAKELRVTIRWGDYKPLHAPGEDDHEAVDGQGMPQAWQRTDRAEEFLLKLPTSQKPAEREVPKSNGLKLALSVRPVRDIPAFAEMVPKGTRSVSLFLVNRRKPAPDILRDAAFAFQATLEASTEQPFVPRPNLRGLESDDWDERVADLQYRDVCEFAVGHGISTEAVLDEKGDCQRVHTRWIPEAEVERVAPVSIEGVELEMEKLAQLSDVSTAKAKLSMLVTHYRTWIDQQKAKVPASPDCRRETATELLLRANVAANRIEAVSNSSRTRKCWKPFASPTRSWQSQLVAASWRSRKSIRPIPTSVLEAVSIGLHPDEPEGNRGARSCGSRGCGFAVLSHRRRQNRGVPRTGRFTLVLRRLRNPGLASVGLSVLMRYTLRLLTLDQLGQGFYVDLCPGVGTPAKRRQAGRLALRDWFMGGASSDAQ